MKKSLIALAVLAVSGAAMAQSTVTLYGIADVWFGSDRVDLGDGNGKLSQTRLDSGGVNGARWGLKGSEDLGGGLKANFNLESGFSMDSGAQGQGALFGRQAWVGVSGGFGAVKLGRMSTTIFDLAGPSNAMFNSALAPLANVGRVNDRGNKTLVNGALVATGNTLRFNNAISYTTPNMSGFSGTLQYALGENKTNTTSADSAMGLGLSYAGGPLGVQLAYQVESCDGAASLTGAAACVGNEDRKFTFLGANYDFGAAVLKASYGRVSNILGADGANSNEYQIGVDVPMSSALVLSASYARAKDNATQSGIVNAAGTGDVKRDGFGIGAKYVLSKRTFIYGGYETDKQTKTGTADYKHNLFAIGVNHKF